MVIYEVICENIKHMYMHTNVYVCLYFREELKVIKYEFRKASCGGDVMRKRTHAR